MHDIPFNEVYTIVGSGERNPGCQYSPENGRSSSSCQPFFLLPLTVVEIVPDREPEQEHEPHLMCSIADGKNLADNVPLQCIAGGSVRQLPESKLNSMP